MTSISKKKSESSSIPPENGEIRKDIGTGKHVFILGAGFSNAISDEMPTMKKLGKLVLDRYDKKESLSSFQVDQIKSNFESAITDMAIEKPWMSEADRLCQHAVFLELAKVIALCIRERMEDAVTSFAKEVPDWIKVLIRFWHDHECLILTLNYDTLVECLIKEVTSQEGTTNGVSLASLYPMLLTPAPHRIGAVLFPDQKRTLQLLKLHGSINWFYSGRREFSGETIYYTETIPGPNEIWRRDEGSEARQMEMVKDKTPLIIPPVLEKSTFFENESIRSLWFRSGRALSEAERITSLGYSLPESDFTMKSLLQYAGQNCGRKIGFEIVDKVPGKHKHFEDVLQIRDMNFCQEFSGDDAIRDYVLDRLVG